jgi:hypothetical protein
MRRRAVPSRPLSRAVWKQVDCPPSKRLCPVHLDRVTVVVRTIFQHPLFPWSGAKSPKARVRLKYPLLARTLPLKGPLFLFHHHMRGVKSQPQTLALRSQALKLGRLPPAVAPANGLPLTRAEPPKLVEFLPLPPSALCVVPLFHPHLCLPRTHLTLRLPFLLLRRYLVHRRPDIPS